MSLFNKYLTIIQESKKIRLPVPKYYPDKNERKGLITSPMRSYYDLEKEEKRKNKMFSSKPYEFEDEKDLSYDEIQKRIEKNLEKEEDTVEEYIDPYAEYERKKSETIHNDIDLVMKLKKNIPINMQEIYNKPSLSYTYIEYMKDQKKEIDPKIRKKLEESILLEPTYFLKYSFLTKNQWLDENKANIIINDTLEDIKNNFPGQILQKLKSVYELSSKEIDYIKKKYPIYFK